MIYKIAFAGPPASGKSTTLELLKHFKHAENVHVIYLNEIATAFMDWPEYVAAHDNTPIRQYYIMKAQILLEDLAMQEAAFFDKDIVLILCDRAVLDVFVYLDKDEAANIVDAADAENYGKRYDYVLYFEPTGEAQFLSRNNSSRIETSYNEVKKVSERTLSAWREHFNRDMIFIPPADTVEAKTNNTARKINELLKTEIWKVN